MPDHLHETPQHRTASSSYPLLHYELWMLEPTGTSFLLCLCDEDDQVLASFELPRRYGRLLRVLKGAAHERARAPEWRGYLRAAIVGERYAALAKNPRPLEVQAVRAMVFELRRMVKQNFAHAAGSESRVPPIIETLKLVGYRVPSTFKSLVVE